MTAVLDEAPASGLPPHWGWHRLGDLSEECRRGRSPAYDGGTTLVVNQKCVRPGMILDLAYAKRTNEASKPLPDWAVLRAGDILVNSTGTGTLGRTALLTTVPERVTADTHVAVVRPLRDVVSPAFVALYLHSLQKQLEDMSTGSTNQRELRPGDLARLPVPLPPLPEQERIVETVEELMTQIAEGERQLRSASDEAAKYRQAVLSLPFCGGYARARLSELGDVVLGFTPSRKSPELWDGEVPWVSSGEVAFRRIDATRETIAVAALGKRDLNPPGTVLIAMYGEGKTRGQAAILGIEAVTNQAVAAIRLDPDKMLPEFLYQCLMHEYSAIRAVAQGGQQPNLNGEMVRSIEIPLPSIADQHVFAEAAERQMAGADQMESSLRRSLANAQVLRAAILRDAMAGKLTQSTYA